MPTYSPFALLLIALVVGVVLAMVECEPGIRKALSVAVVVLVVVAIVLFVLPLFGAI
jgi:dolichyl-phosphate-mannose--protein O-mannosyl transferase